MTVIVLPTIAAVIAMILIATMTTAVVITVAVATTATAIVTEMMIIRTIMMIQKIMCKRLVASWYNTYQIWISVRLAQCSIQTLVPASRKNFVLLHSVLTPLAKKST